MFETLLLLLTQWCDGDVQMAAGLADADFRIVCNAKQWEDDTPLSAMNLQMGSAVLCLRSGAAVVAPVAATVAAPVVSAMAPAVVAVSGAVPRPVVAAPAPRAVPAAVSGGGGPPVAMKLIQLQMWGTSATVTVPGLLPVSRFILQSVVVSE